MLSTIASQIILVCEANDMWINREQLLNNFKMIAGQDEKEYIDAAASQASAGTTFDEIMKRANLIIEEAEKRDFAALGIDESRLDLIKAESEGRKIYAIRDETNVCTFSLAVMKT